MAPVCGVANHDEFPKLELLNVLADEAGQLHRPGSIMMDLPDLPSDTLIWFVDQNEQIELFLGDSSGSRRTAPPTATIIMHRHASNSYALVSYAEASSGWGPLLYRAAIVVATERIGGLVPDRGTVSNDARALWDRLHYYCDEVQKRPLGEVDNESLHDDVALDAVYWATPEMMSAFAVSLHEVHETSAGE